VEASPYMQCSKSLGYLAYPLLTFFLAAALSMQAQTTSDPQQSAPPSQSPAPSTDAQPTPLTPTAPVPTTRDPISQAQQQQSGSSGSRPQANYPNEQERVRLAQEAQARVRARRAARTAAVIKDTYSHKYDIYFGYNYLRMRPGHFLQHGNEYGWNAGITRYFNPKFGISLDLRGYYKSVYVGNVRYFIPEGTDPVTGKPIYGTVEGMFQPFISNYSAMVGPQYWVRQRKAYAVGFQVLAGATYNIFNANSAGLPGYYVGLYDNGTRFTAAAVMPVDINLGPGLAFRIAPDYNLTTWKYRYDTVTSTSINQFSGTDLQHNLGFTLGLNYRFGRQ
jgi:hypothetical protein